jgi:hypothetical protein
MTFENYRYAPGCFARAAFLYASAIRRLLASVSLSVVALFFLVQPIHATQLLPGAYGFGMDRSSNSAGFGSGLIIIHVENLSNDGNGSLRDALSQNTSGAPRVIVFDTSGVINLTSDLVINNANTTIAGQTAPPPGIVIKGAALRVQRNNVLVQHLRIWPGDNWLAGSLNNRDGANVAVSTGNGGPATNIVFDHCTFMWTMDEAAECYTDFNSVSFNRCIFAEPLNISHHVDEQMFPNNTPPAAEMLTNTKPSGTTVGNMTSGDAFGGQYQKVTTGSAGWIEYRVDFTNDDKQKTQEHIQVVCLTGEDRGRFKVEIRDHTGNLVKDKSGNTVGNPPDIFDAYDAVEKLKTFTVLDFAREFVVPAIDLDENPTGEQYIKVKLIVVGKNAASSGYNFGVDFLNVVQPHGFGPLISSGRSGDGKASFTNCIFASSVNRNPSIAAKQFIFSNNVLYNRSQRFNAIMLSTESGAMNAAIVGNNYIEGPSKESWVTTSPIWQQGTQAGSKIYIYDNAYNYGDWTGHPNVADSFGSLASATDEVDYDDGMAGFIPMSASTALPNVLADCGAFPAYHDAAETRIISEIAVGKDISELTSRPGSLKNTVEEAGGYPTYAVNDANWTLPSDPDGDAGGGYTNIEVWLHDLAEVAEDGGGRVDPSNPVFDDFEDDDAAGWTEVDGAWSVVTDGSYVYRQANASGLGRTLFGGTNWNDQAIEADARALSLNSFYGVMARYQDADNYYYFILRSNGLMELKKIINGTSTVLDSDNLPASPFSTASWNTLALSVEGTSLKAYLNGVLVLQATDSTFASGPCGLLTYLTSAEFDNVAADPDPTVTAAEIVVIGNGNSISDGDTTPSMSDDTDFGNAAVSSGTVSHTFTIQNAGTATLTIGSASISGTHASDFSITSQPASSVTVGNSTTFTVQFAPSATGLRTATISFSTSDSSENPFNFLMQGTGTSGSSEVNVTGSSVTIADGDSMPGTADDTDFGYANVSSGVVSHTFTIQNTGTATLTIGTVSVSGTYADDFTVTSQPASSVAASGSTTFIVQFDPSASGLHTAELSFSTNDNDENPYNFSIQGTGTNSTTVTITANTGTLANEDGYIYETSAGSGIGASVVTSGVNETRVGDYVVSSTDRQVKAVFSFDTSSLPDNALITAATLRLFRDVHSDSPTALAVLGDITVDISNGGFGGDPTLVAGDFQATASASDISIMGTTSGDDEWSSGTINSSGIAQISRTGRTQLRLTSATVNANGVSTYYGYSSAGASSNQPELVITYEDAASAPEANVIGNGHSIADGDATPSATDDTDFGSADTASDVISHTFTIQNTGTTTLSLGTVVVSGTYASDFTVTAQPATSVAASASTTFTVQFNPSGTGLRTAILSVSTNDSDENPYGFSIQGTGTSTTTVTIVATSAAAGEDGRVAESSETSGLGGSVTTSGYNEIRAGDDASDRQYKGFLSFDTSSIPDEATIVSATLRLRHGVHSGIVSNIYSALGSIQTDISNAGSGGFGGATALVAGDFQTTSNVTTSVTTLSQVLSIGDWATGSLNSAGLAQINKTGRTQFRIYFTTDDNNNDTAEYIGFSSAGNPTGEQPELVVTYQQ